MKKVMKLGKIDLKKEEDRLKNIIDNTMRFGASKEWLSKLENVLSENVLSLDLKEDFRKDPDELKRLQARNLWTNYAETYVDHHPYSEIREISEPVRATIWKCAGVRCDDFSKLHVGKGVRFFNPTNITVVTGGYDLYFAGLRSGTFVDGRGEVVIFGPADIAAGAKIFTHEHPRDNPNLPSYSQGRFLIPCIIYPDCAIGEDTHIFGSIQAKTILADTSVTNWKKSFPPYSIIGGIGSAYRILRYIDFPENFPPEHFARVLEAAEENFPELGKMLKKYYDIVKKLIEASGDRQENWNTLKEKVTSLEKQYLDRKKLSSRR